MARISSLHRINRLIGDSYASFMRRHRNRQKAKNGLNESLVLRAPKFAGIGNSRKPTREKRRGRSKLGGFKSCVSLHKVKLGEKSRAGKQIQRRSENLANVNRQKGKKRRKGKQALFGHLKDFYETLGEERTKTRNMVGFKMKARKRFRREKIKSKNVTQSKNRIICRRRGGKLNKTVSPSKSTFLPLFGKIN